MRLHDLSGVYVGGEKQLCMPFEQIGNMNIKMKFVY